MSHAEPPRDPELRAVESALAGLIPAATVNRDRLLFEAGRRSAARGRAWPLAAIGFATLSAVLALHRPEPAVRVVERLVYFPVPTSSAEVVEKAPEPPADERTLAAAPTVPGNEYLRQRDQVLRWGADALPNLPPAPAGPATPPESMLGLSRGFRAAGLTQ